MTQNDTTQRIDRRTVLRALGATAGLAGLGTATADEEQPTHEICINAPSDRSAGYPYQFAVTGEIEKADATQHDTWLDSVVTSDAEDDIDGTGCRVHGYVNGGVDCYRFTGKIVAFSVPQQWAHKYRIHVNGQKRTPGHLRTQQDPSEVECGDGSDDSDDGSAAPDPDAETHDDAGFCPLDNSLWVTPHKSKSEPFMVEVEVSGQIELEDGQRVSAARFTVEGRGTAGAMKVPYSGEIVALSTDGPGSVTINQNDACKDGGK